MSGRPTIIRPGVQKLSFGGLFSRYAHITRPGRAFENGLGRVGWDAGRYGGPLLGAYLGGRYLGLWGPNSRGIEGITEDISNEMPDISIPSPLGPGRGGIPFKESSAPAWSRSPTAVNVGTLPGERPRVLRPGRG